MGKYVTLTISSKKLAEIPDVRKWVKECEEQINKGIEEALTALITTGTTARRKRDGEVYSKDNNAREIKERSRDEQQTDEGAGRSQETQ